MEPTYSLPEVVAMLLQDGAAPKTVAAFQKRAEFVAEKRAPHTRSDDVFEVGSGYSSLKDRGHVRFKTGASEHQLTPEKAKQVGMWLIEASEAAIADTVIMTWLKLRMGVDAPEKLGAILLDLREIRQGSRDVVFHQ